MGAKYAIIRTGGKQYRVEEGDVIDVEKLAVSEDKKVEFNEVLFCEGKVGTPIVEGCKVVGELIDEVRGKKVIAFKYKRRQNYHRKVGHRQPYSRVKIMGIQNGS